MDFSINSWSFKIKKTNIFCTLKIKDLRQLRDKNKFSGKIWTVANSYCCVFCVKSNSYFNCQPLYWIIPWMSTQYSTQNDMLIVLQLKIFHIHALAPNQRVIHNNLFITQICGLNKRKDSPITLDYKFVYKLSPHACFILSIAL